MIYSLNCDILLWTVYDTFSFINKKGLQRSPFRFLFFGLYRRHQESQYEQHVDNQNEQVSAEEFAVELFGVLGFFVLCGSFGLFFFGEFDGFKAVVCFDTLYSRSDNLEELQDCVGDKTDTDTV